MTAEVRCSVCGRRLTIQKWMDRGIGPTCWAKLKRIEAEEQDIAPLQDEGAEHHQYLEREEERQEEAPE